VTVMTMKIDAEIDLAAVADAIATSKLSTRELLAFVIALEGLCGEGLSYALEQHYHARRTAKASDGRVKAILAGQDTPEDYKRVEPDDYPTELEKRERAREAAKGIEAIRKELGR
jgi:hypothetical protein